MILSKLGQNLHLSKNHPLSIIKCKVEEYCHLYAAQLSQPPFKVFDSLPPVVSTTACFDNLLITEDHVSRKSSDTYYITDTTLLRTHTSAHQCDLMSAGNDAFLCSGDVYRRDEVDASHYPVFHQMEGVRVFDKSKMSKQEVEDDLMNMLTGLCRHLFGQDIEMRWNPDYFPFTEPSFEIEVKYMGDWMEVLGSGVIHDEVLRNAGLNPDEKVGWAFGLGLERLAMILFSIPDIRLFWTQDQRFLSQFKEGEIITFDPYSKYPPCYKDVSFWLPQECSEEDMQGKTEFHINEVYEV
jgi:phenylalanyl-tRNA synthetase alpha chain